MDTERCNHELRDRMKASFSENVDWETEEAAIDMDIDLEMPFRGLLESTAWL